MHINLDSKNLKIAFAICLALTVAIPSIEPTLRLLFFAPFLIIAIYQTPLKIALWLALACGLILDLLSSSPRLGIYSMSFCLAMLLVYPQRKNFFADSLSTLPIMTFVFSAVATFILACLLYIIDMHNVFSWQWFFTDVLVMPAADALFAFALFILPALAMGKRIRRGKDYFLVD